MPKAKRIRGHAILTEVPVDPALRRDDTWVWKVVRMRDEVCSEVKHFVSVMEGKAMYSIVQLVKHIEKDEFILWSRWGKIGSMDGYDTNVLNPYRDARTAFRYYCRRKVQMNTRLTAKFTGNFSVNEMSRLTDIGQIKSKRFDMAALERPSPADNVGAKEKLMKSLRPDVRTTGTFQAMNGDLTVTYLGKPTKLALQNARKALKPFREWRLDITDRARYSEKFYSFIPHPVVRDLGSDTILAEKHKLLDSLQNTYVMAGRMVPYKNSRRWYSNGVMKSITEVEKESYFYKSVGKCVENQQIFGESQYKLANLFIYDKDDYTSTPCQPDDNATLLWHGTSTCCIPGILSNGFAMRHSRKMSMFGKGFYFTDTVYKALSYSNFVDLAIFSKYALLCEVKLKKVHSKTTSTPYFGPPPPYQSTKGVGRIQPNPDQIEYDDNGAKLFTGPMIGGDAQSDLAYNEYAVYDSSVIKVRYIAEIIRCPHTTVGC